MPPLRYMRSNLCKSNNYVINSRHQTSKRQPQIRETQTSRNEKKMTINNCFEQEAQGARTATENEAMTSNGFKAIFTTTATDGKDVKITIEHNNEDGSDLISPLWGVVAAANAYTAVPTALLGSASKAAILRDFGVAVFGDEKQFIRAFNTATARLAMLRSFIDWCETNEVDRFAVAQNIVYDGYDMYSRVQDSGVEAVYGELVEYYGEPIFELN